MNCPNTFCTWITLEILLLIYCFMYASDLFLLSTTSNSEQSKLDILEKYCNDWCLSVNLSKTKNYDFQQSKKNCQKIFLFKILSWLSVFNRTNNLVFTFVTPVPLPLLKMNYIKSMLKITERNDVQLP